MDESGEKPINPNELITISTMHKSDKNPINPSELIKVQPQSNHLEDKPVTVAQPELDPVAVKRKYLEDIRLPKNKKRKYCGIKAHELCPILENDPFKFCQDHGLLAPSVMCYCGRPAGFWKRPNTLDGYRWTCKRGEKHAGTMPIRRGTWFDKSRLAIKDILWIAYMWVHEYSHIAMLHECDQTNEDIIEWCSKCSDLCQTIMEQKSEPIGGHHKLVEIFECKTVDKKITKTEVKEWVFCALEQFDTKSVLIPVEDKESETLLALFKKYIQPGTTVFSHIWNPYKDLNSDDFTFLTQERKIIFYDAITKSEIETIEDFWTVAERPLPGLNYWNKFVYDSKFCEYMYRKSLSFSPDAFRCFLKDVAMIYKPHDKTVLNLSKNKESIKIEQ